MINRDFYLILIVVVVSSTDYKEVLISKLVAIFNVFVLPLSLESSIFKDHWTLNGGVLLHANSAHVVSVTVAGLNESMITCGAVIELFLTVGLLVVYHVAQFWCFDMTAEAFE